jgi:hypothetical protein
MYHMSVSSAAYAPADAVATANASAEWRNSNERLEFSMTGLSVAAASWRSPAK